MARHQRSNMLFWFGQYLVCLLAFHPLLRSHTGRDTAGYSPLAAEWMQTQRITAKTEQKQPPSLQNIFKELNDDLGIPIPKTGYLKPWADQGVLLLNTILTVRRGEAYSHKGMGWERLTDLIIEKLNDRKDPVIFLLWGAPARQKKALITNPWHYVLEAPHPSPLSAYSGYFGCKHFSKTNAILFSLGKAPIDWRIE